jgi:hypothetical protein
MAPSDRDRAKSILAKLKKSRGFSWNSKTGVVRFGNRREKGSNIRALLADAVANRRQLSTDEHFDLISTLLVQ